MRDFQVSVYFDMRSPEWATPTRELYTAALEMAAYCDKNGFDSVGVMEHHGSDDGYLPQPFVLGSAMAAVTERLRLMLGAVILPLHEPRMLAEQIAVLDIISGGRLSVIFGAGYVPYEFEMFGKSLKERGRSMDAGIELILRALKGERFEMDGRPVFTRPLPIQAPEDIIMVGGGVPASAKRAARFDVGFGPMTADLIDLYLAECERLGQTPRRCSRPVSGMPLAIHLCEDPEAGWQAIERHAVHVITEYAKWAEAEGDSSNSPFKGLSDPAALKHSGLFAAWTPEHLMDKIHAKADLAGVGIQPLLGGLSPQEGWKSVKLLSQMMPDIRAAAAARD